mgnify:FL=1
MLLEFQKHSESTLTLACTRKPDLNLQKYQRFMLVNHLKNHLITFREWSWNLYLFVSIKDWIHPYFVITLVCRVNINVFLSRSTVDVNITVYYIDNQISCCLLNMILLIMLINTLYRMEKTSMSLLSSRIFLWQINYMLCCLRRTIVG